MNDGVGRSFLTSVLRLTLALVFAAVGIGILAVGAYWAYEKHNDAINAELEKPKKFENGQGTVLKATFSLTTIWREGSLQYKLTIKADKQDLEKLLDAPNDATVSLIFLDANGFELLPWTDVKVHEMPRHHGQDGKINGLDAQGTVPMSADLYRRISDWNLVGKGV